MGRATRLRTRIKAVSRHWSEWTPVEVTAEMREKHPHLEHCGQIFANSRFEVQVFPIACPGLGGVQQVCVTRHGDLERISWDDLQRVKRELFGEHSLALEVYPPDDCETHFKREIRVLWVQPVGHILPYGLHLESAFGRKGE